MSFLDTIDNIRGKSARVKNGVALFGSIFGTALIVGIWLLTQGSPISETEASAKETIAQLKGPFSTIKDMGASIYEDVRDLSGLIKSKTSEYNSAGK